MCVCVCVRVYVCVCVGGWVNGLVCVWAHANVRVSGGQTKRAGTGDEYMPEVYMCFPGL